MNFSVLSIALVWAFMYNSYFGWNFTSESAEEVICDGIFVVIVAISLVK